MYCKHCGKEIADDSKYCQHCGKSLEVNNINYWNSIKTFITSHTMIVKIVLGILICAALGWTYYINVPSNMIVGEWEREIRIGTDILIFNSDGTWKSKTYSPGFDLVDINGEWSISGSTLTISFGMDGKQWFDKYEIIKLSSKELVLKGETGGTESLYKRTK